MCLKILIAVLMLTTTTLSAVASIKTMNPSMDDRMFIGAAEFVKLKQKVYHAELYCGAYDSVLNAGLQKSEPCLANLEHDIVMKFVLNKKMSARRLWTLWQNGLLRNSSQAELESHSDNIPKLEKILFRNVKKPDQLETLKNSSDEKVGDLAKKIIGLRYDADNSYEVGDHIVFHYQPNDGVTVYWNTQSMGHLDDGKLINILLSVWTGNRPPSASFKNAILGIEEMSSDIVDRVSLNAEVAKNNIKRAKNTLVNENKLLSLVKKLTKAEKNVKERLIAEEKELKRRQLAMEEEQKKIEQEMLEANRLIALQAEEAAKIKLEKDKELSKKRERQRELTSLHISELKRQIVSQFSSESVQKRLRRNNKFGVVGFSVKVNRDGTIGNVLAEKTSLYTTMSDKEKAKQDKLNSYISGLVKKFDGLKEMPNEIEAPSVSVVIWMDLKYQS